MTDRSSTNATSPPDRTGTAVRSALVWNLAHQGISQVVAAAVFIYLANRLDPVVFGLFAFAVLFVDVFAQQGRVSLVDILVMRRDFSPENLSSVLYVATGAALFAYAVVTLVVPAIPWDDSLVSLGPLVAVLGLTILAAPLGAVLEALVLRDLQFRALAVRNIVATLVSGLAAVAAVFASAGEWALVVQRITAVLVGLAVLMHFVRWRPILVLRPAMVMRTAAPFFKTWLDQMIVFGLARVVDMIVGLRFGAAALGLFRVSGRLVEMVESATSAPLTGVFVPVLSRHAGDPARRAGHYLQIVSLSALATAPLLTGLALLSSDAVAVFLAPAYREAAPILAALAAAGLVAPLTQFRSVALIGAGRPGAAAALSLVDLAVTTAFALVGSAWGVVGTAAGVLMAALAAALLTSVVIRRVLDIRITRLLQACAPPYVASLIMAAALIAVGFYLDTWNELIRLVVLVPLGAFVFAGCLVLFYTSWLSARIGYLRGSGGSC